MARRKYSLDKKKIDRFLSEGRRKGSGADYKPWFTVQAAGPDIYGYKVLYAL